jgi:hypothetical protein
VHNTAIGGEELEAVPPRVLTEADEEIDPGEGSSRFGMVAAMEWYGLIATEAMLLCSGRRVLIEEGTPVEGEGPEAS